MADLDDVRNLALSLPGTVEEEGRFAFSVLDRGKRKGIIWVWLERVHPKKARIPNHDVMAVRVADESEKEMLIASEPAKFFTEPHYDGYPAVMVRLAAVDREELRELITDAWRVQAPRALVEEFERGSAG